MATTDDRRDGTHGDFAALVGRAPAPGRGGNGRLRACLRELTAARGLSIVIASMAVLPGGPAPAAVSAQTIHHHFACRVTSSERVEHLGLNGGSAELTRFECTVKGGLLDGFAAAGTTLRDARTDGSGDLLASLLIAQKGPSSVVSELDQGTRTVDASAQPTPNWHSSARGTYKLATGSAAALSGKSFRAVTTSDRQGAFTIDAVVTD